jgi:hypothetical protein
MRGVYRRCVDPLRMQGVDNPVRDVMGVSGIAEMLELTPATRREVPTRRRGMIGTRFDRSTRQQPVTRCGERRVSTIGRNSLAARRNPDDQVRIAHSVAGSR